MQTTHQCAVNPALTILDATDLSNVHEGPGLASVLERPFLEGQDARKSGKPITDNPHTGSTAAWSLWALGWDMAA